MASRPAHPMCVEPSKATTHPWFTPGPLGRNDFADPNRCEAPPGDTPGFLGGNDFAWWTAASLSKKVETATGKGTSGLDVDASIVELDKNALDDSKGRCSYYVAVAINAGLPAGKTKLTVVDASELGPANGGKMGPVLTKIGFVEVAAKDYKPQKGDVAVTPSYKGYTGATGGEGPGHVCMYDGSQWISDFKQGQNAKGYGAKYTKKDEDKGRIPEGSKVGDARLYPSETRYYRP